MVKSIAWALVSVLVLMILNGCIPDDELDAEETPWSRNYEGIEPMYFDPRDRRWKDMFGICHTCTPEHGFGLDGEIFNEAEVDWILRRFKLKNGFGENPPISDVRSLFFYGYSVYLSLYGTHAEEKDGVYTVILAVPKGRGKSRDSEYFLDPQGLLSTSYTAVAVDP